MMGNEQAWQGSGTWTSNTGCFVPPSANGGAFYAGGVGAPPPPEMGFGSNNAAEAAKYYEEQDALFQRKRSLDAAEPSTGSFGECVG